MSRNYLFKARDLAIKINNISYDLRDYSCSDRSNLILASSSILLFDDTPEQDLEQSFENILVRAEKSNIRKLGTIYLTYSILLFELHKSMPLQPVNADFYSLEDPNAELSPPSEFLYFIPKAGGNYLYFGNLPIHYKNKFIGTVILKLSPKNYSKTNLYPELLLEENIKPPDERYIYSYAIYLNNIRSGKKGYTLIIHSSILPHPPVNILLPAKRNWNTWYIMPAMVKK